MGILNKLSPFRKKAGVTEDTVFDSEKLDFTPGQFKNDRKKLIEANRERLKKCLEDGIDPWGQGKMAWEIANEIQFLSKYQYSK